MQAALILFLAAVLAGCSPIRSFEATAFLEDVAAGEGPSELKETTPEPRRTATSFRAGEDIIAADLYRPGGKVKPLAAVLMVPGVARGGKDDPRLVAFARTFARARFAVLVPDIPNFRRLRVGTKDPKVVAAGIRALTDDQGPVTAERIGVVAFSYAAGPAILASIDEGSSVAFIYLVGPYYDLEQVIVYLTTGYYRASDGEDWMRGEPSPYGKWVFLASNARRIADPADRERLSRIAELKLADPAADVDGLAEALGPEGRSVYELLTAEDPDRAERLIGRLPSGIREEIAALDVSRVDLGGLEARATIVHARDDRLIPFTESQRLAAAVPGEPRLHLLESGAHVEPAFTGLSDLGSLWSAAYTLLDDRDSMPPPVMRRAR